jgi:hypothetical protein
MSVDGTLGLGDLLVDPAQCSPRSVVAVLVVHDPIRDSAGLLTTAGRPRLGQHQLIGNSLVGVFVAPFPDHVGQKRDPGAQDERQPRSLQRVGGPRRDDRQRLGCRLCRHAEVEFSLAGGQPLGGGGLQGGQSSLVGSRADVLDRA